MKLILFFAVLPTLISASSEYSGNTEQLESNYEFEESFGVNMESFQAPPYVSSLTKKPVIIKKQNYKVAHKTVKKHQASQSGYEQQTSYQSHYQTPKPIYKPEKPQYSHKKEKKKLIIVKIQKPVVNNYNKPNVEQQVQQSYKPSTSSYGPDLVIYGQLKPKPKPKPIVKVQKVKKVIKQPIKQTYSKPYPIQQSYKPSMSNYESKPYDNARLKPQLIKKIHESQEVSKKESVKSGSYPVQQSGKKDPEKKWSSFFLGLRERFMGR